MADIDAKHLQHALGRLAGAVKEGKFGDVNSIVFSLSQEQGTGAYSKQQAMMLWLTGYLFADTVFVCFADKMLVFTSKKKAEALKPPTEGSPIPCEFIIRNKADKDAANIKKVVETITAAGKRVGYLVNKRKLDQGPFLTSFYAALEKSAELVDASEQVAVLLAGKTDEEVAWTEVAATASSLAMNKEMKRSLLNNFGEPQPAAHEEIAAGVRESVENGKQAAKLKLSPHDFEVCYEPIVQSGKRLSLKLSVMSDERRLKPGVVLCSVGIKYKSMCANVGRTFFVEATKDQEENYKFALEMSEVLQKALKPGATLGDAHAAVVSFVQEKRPELVDHLPKTLGFSTGLEFRDSFLTIKANNQHKITANMTLCLTVGLQDLKSKKGEYAINIVDTVVVKESGVEVLTAKSKSTWDHCSFEFDQEEKETTTEDAVRELLKDEHRPKRQTTTSFASKEDQRREHQKELGRKLHEAAKRRLENEGDVSDEEEHKEEIVAYTSNKAFPKREAARLKIFVDSKHETVILPIFGIATPFHISTIKNTSYADDTQTPFLRINFATPGITTIRSGATAGQPSLVYLKEISYRGSAASIQAAHTGIKNLQSRYRQLERERKEREDLVEQADLVLRRDPNRRLVLRDLFMRPNTHKRAQGMLEAHENGLRYSSRKGDNVDILYSNIKHAFFQPPEHEVQILLHFHLKNAILIGKKQHKDITFYTEIGEVQTDLAMSRFQRSERDEYEAEQRERRMRRKLKQLFRQFFEQVERETDGKVQFEVPNWDLGFPGVPFKTTVHIRPTENCLVNLSEQPAFVLPLSDVERVHFERMDFRNRSFDMVFIFKDYKRKVQMISNIPMQHHDHLMTWLDDRNIKYTQATLPIKWNRVMKEVVENYSQFIEDGGWSFLEDEDEEEEQGEDGEPIGSDKEDSDFQVSEDELEEEESDEEEFEDDDFDDEEEEDEEEFVDDEEGESWEELERQAAEEDRKRAHNQHEERTSRQPSKRPKRR
ncbi:hypothetical protein PTSG_07243 [Salpingoeca rosetta]|uniref:FACT complex subunit n=1 Tax=Salpingoeca rosetta (strain ATCC 50818 / BSB-021) TaxID=946362 RepID=F2UEG8_SALR5|nr:uncharacterized protein PTSG_07243 [Salpingoeca rosetta]EGD75018.1 hypothetical protein PTSG_07243 [Salpingoeca rosetta]|eukprot:XP_004992662.1 hypothetical protein PTSG_07243 [Salpingoeca rosetta]